MPRSTDSNAATGETVEDASAVNPGGGAKTVSRWDIQQLCWGGVPASSRPGSRHGQLASARTLRPRRPRPDRPARARSAASRNRSRAPARRARAARGAAPARRPRTPTPARRTGSRPWACVAAPPRGRRDAGSSSENTPHSRTRRAISCEYWPPKSRTSDLFLGGGPLRGILRMTLRQARLARQGSRAGRRRKTLRPRPDGGGAHARASFVMRPLSGRGTRPQGRRAQRGPVSRLLDTDRRGRRLGAHADALLALEVLALRLERRAPPRARRG